MFNTIICHRLHIYEKQFVFLNERGNYIECKPYKNYCNNPKVLQDLQYLIHQIQSCSLKQDGNNLKQSKEKQIKPLKNPIVICINQNTINTVNTSTLRA